MNGQTPRSPFIRSHHWQSVALATTPSVPLLQQHCASPLRPLTFHLLHRPSVPSPTPDPACCPNLAFSLCSPLCSPMRYGQSAEPQPLSGKCSPQRSTMSCYCLIPWGHPQPALSSLCPEYSIIISTSAPALVPFLLLGMLFRFHSALSNLSLPLLKAWPKTHLLPKVFTNQFGPNETPFSELL